MAGYNTYYYTISESQAAILYYYYEGGSGDTGYYTTTAGTAKYGVDFTAQNGSVTVNPYTRTRQFSPFAPINDDIYEGNETLTVRFVDSDEENIYYYTITDEEDRPRVTVPTLTRTETNSESVLEIGISTLRAAAFGYDVTVKTISGTAVEGKDFVGINTTVRIEPMQTGAYTKMTILGDLFKEGIETFTIQTTSIFGTYNATITIRDDDPDPVQRDPAELAQDGATKELITNLAAAYGEGLLVSAAGLSGGLIYDTISTRLGIGTDVIPFARYYDDVMKSPMKFANYSSAFEDVGKVAGAVGVITNVGQAVSTAFQDVRTSGEFGRPTSQASGQLAAAMLTGILGEYVGAATTSYVAGLTYAAGAAAVSSVALPLLAGVAVGVAVSYYGGPLISSSGTMAVDWLYGGPLTQQSVTRMTSQISSNGSVAGIEIGRPPPAAAWRYNESTKELTWLDNSKSAEYEKLLYFTGVKTSGLTINGDDALYSKTGGLIGTVGADTIYGSARSEYISGGNGMDFILAGGGRNFIDAGDGHDSVYGGSDRDVILGGEGHDYISGAEGNDELEGQAGDDQIVGGHGDDIIRGGEGADVLQGNQGTDRVYGDAGDDVFIGQPFSQHPDEFADGLDILDGGEGSDTFDWSGYHDAAVHPDLYPHAYALYVDLSAGESLVYYSPGNMSWVPNGFKEYTNKITNIENVVGLSVYSSNLTGNDSANTLRGGLDYDVLRGLGGADKLEGGDGYDALSGGDGDDALDGGSGGDTLAGDAGVDRIHGGSGYDTVWFELARSQYVVTQTDAMITVRALSSGEGTDYIGSVESLRFADQEVRTLGLLGDFNGDGRADLTLQGLPQRSKIGWWWEAEPMGTWFMSGENVLSGSALPSLGQGWTAVGVDDTSGDGRSDLLLQNGRSLAMWLMNGDKVEGGGDIATLSGGWMVAGMGDVDGNGRSDVLLQNDRAVAVWQLDGSKLVGGGNIATLGEGWQIAGKGDLNGDGRADLLLQNGQTLAAWHLNGSQLISGGVIETLGAGWSVAGMGDFDGNGRSDILLQNGQQLAIWQVNGTHVDGGGLVAPIAQGWSVSGLGDLNGDHKTDILLQNGQALGTWTMNGTQIVSGATVNEQLAPGWDLA
jgi:Ca2+-binding RTX toxin-like protein